jgi:hypothetical protein
MHTNSNWRKVYDTANYTEAQLLELYLNETCGIEAVLLKKQDSLYLIGRCHIMVPEHKEAAALEAIQKYQNSNNE